MRLPGKKSLTMERMAIYYLNLLCPGRRPNENITVILIPDHAAHAKSSTAADVRTLAPRFVGELYQARSRPSSPFYPQSILLAVHTVVAFTVYDVLLLSRLAAPSSRHPLSFTIHAPLTYNPLYKLHPPPALGLLPQKRHS